MENNEEYVTISLQGYTKQSGLNRGRSPRYITSPQMARYCLTDSCHSVYNPGTVSRVTNATLSTALQAGL